MNRCQGLESRPFFAWCSPKSVLLLGIFFTIHHVKAQVTEIIYDQVINFSGVPDSAQATLLFNSNRSLYSFGKKIKGKGTANDASENSSRTVLRGNEGLAYHTDLNARRFTSREILLSRSVVVLDTMTTIEWQIYSDSTKKIGAFSTIMAKGAFRGRNYTVWFTQELAGTAGPWKLWGLPGVILEGCDEDQVIKFTYRSYRTGDFDLTPPWSSKPITQDNYVGEFKKRLANLMSFVSANAQTGKVFNVKTVGKLHVLERSLYEN